MEANTQLIELTFKGIDIFSIVSSVVSIVLGIVAIVLSILFYKMSEKSSREVERSAKDIDSNVKRLDSVFEKMYTDTFGMVKDTVSDMRRHVYKPTNETNEEGETIAMEIENRTKDIVNKAIIELQEDKLSKSDVEDLVKEIIQESTNVAKKFEEHSMMERVELLLDKLGKATYSELKKKLLLKHGDASLFRALEEMANQGIIVDPFNTNPDNGSKSIALNAVIRLTN